MHMQRLLTLRSRPISFASSSTNCNLIFRWHETNGPTIYVTTASSRGHQSLGLIPFVSQ
jgi:hypothetical protein